MSGTEATGATYGLLAAFDSADALAAAIRRLREAGYRHIDGYSPIPSEEVSEALGARCGRVPAIALCCGLAGAALAYAIQYYTAVHDYPFVVGGKPLHSWPAFLVTTFAFGILSAVLGAVLGMLLLNGFPRPYHPLFNADVFERAGHDRFLLCVRADDPEYDAERTPTLLREAAAETVAEVPP